jgi:hypothetical protein
MFQNSPWNEGSWQIHPVKYCENNPNGEKVAKWVEESTMPPFKNWWGSLNPWNITILLDTLSPDDLPGSGGCRSNW